MTDDPRFVDVRPEENGDDPTEHVLLDLTDEEGRIIQVRLPRRQARWWALKILVAAQESEMPS